MIMQLIKKIDRTWKVIKPSVSSAVFSLVAIIITFAVKSKVKAVGISLIVIGVITTAITNLWGIIALALLLPGGIVALRYKEEKKVST